MIRGSLLSASPRRRRSASPRGRCRRERRCSFAARAAAAGSMRPPSCAPSEMSRIALGGAGSSVAHLAVARAAPRARRHLRSPSPRRERGCRARPRRARGPPSAARRPPHGSRTRRRRRGTSPGPRRGTPCAAARAASSRVGSTSSAFIERETSIARTTVASSRGTLTVACGRATPTIITPSATSRSTAAAGSAAGPARGRSRSAADRGSRTSACEATRRRSRST